MKTNRKEYLAKYGKERRARVKKQHTAMLKLIKKYCPQELKRVIDMV